MRIGVWWLPALWMILLVGGGWAEESAIRSEINQKIKLSEPSPHEVNLTTVKRLYDTHGVLFLDARRFRRYAQGTIMRALNLPVKRFKRMSRWLPRRLDAPLLVFCDGPRCDASAALARRLIRMGYSEVLVYPGGYPEWRRHNLPVMRAPKACDCGDNYRPTTEPVAVEGTTLYLDPEDESRIDARWIAPLLRQGTLPEGLHLIDVRKASQFAAGHLPGATNIPFDEEAMSLDLSKLPSKGPILFTCKHGSISSDAWFSLPEKIQKRAFILDADVVCRESNCTITAH